MGNRLLILAGLALSIGCATTKPVKKGEEAKYLYEVAMAELEDGLYPEAIARFKVVKRKYPYSPFAHLADLRVPDAQFAQGQYDEAVDGYSRFIKYHPLHPEVPYATLRIGDAYFERIPNDWWFLPPSAEKDQAFVKLAIGGYRDVLTLHPKSPHAKTAEAQLKMCRTKLATHEMYVANFYFDRNRPKAAARRAEGVLKTYPGLGFDAKALWLGAQARIANDETELAAKHLSRLVEQFADTDEAANAKDELAKLNKNQETQPSTP